MPSKRHWHQSQLSMHSCIYVETVETQFADGMPKQENKLLGWVYRNGTRYDAVLCHPDGDVYMPDFATMLAAQTAACNYLSTHEPFDHHAPYRQLP